MIDGREAITHNVVFANEIGVNFTDNDCVLKFSVQGEPSAIQAQVGLTHRTAKLLYVMLQEIIQSYEAKTGTEVPFDPEKLKHLREALKKSTNPANV